ncbi:MAG: hypothetical protein EBZ67_02010 [Chitinophagia bacterium]|nr:hypothetical protein [Chitinophagia bacterium]
MVLSMGFLAYRYRHMLMSKSRQAFEIIVPFNGGLSETCPGCVQKFPDRVPIQETAYRRGRLKAQSTMDDLDGLLRKGILVELEDNDRFIIREMEHSRPYVLPIVVDFLERLSRAYALELKARKLSYRPFEIISATRSIDSADKLTEENSIARRWSHHLHGKTIDISYKRFGRHEGEKICLIEALSKLRQQGRCYVKYERKGALHLTVR